MTHRGPSIQWLLGTVGTKWGPNKVEPPWEHAERKPPRILHPATFKKEGEIKAFADKW